MPGKKKKPTKSESESESEASEKEESEEEQDEGSEEEEDEDKGSDEEEDEEEDDEDKEESEENSEKSDKSGESDDEDKSSKSSSSSSKSSKSGSSDGSKSDSDESDGSGKKAKKKKKDKKDKEKAKKGKKGKEEPVVESKKSSSKNELPPEPPKLTIASVFQDLDDLSNHLAKAFTTFNEENKAKEVQKQSSPSASPDRKNDSPLSFPNQRPPIHSATLPGGYGSKTQLKPLVDDTGVQCDPEPAEKRQASPEAIRAVQEYKQRKEQERKRKESPSLSPEEPKAIKNGSQVSQGKHRDNSQPRQERDQEEYERVRREERKREQDNTADFKRRTISPKRTGPNWTRANQIAEDYYSSLYKKSAKNPVSISGQKTVHDLYKYKPKPAFVEDDSQPIVQYDEGDFRRTRDQPTFDVYDPRLKPQNEYSYKYNPLNSNKKPINDAMDVLARKSRNNQKF